MATQTVTYSGTPTAITITLASLATSTTWVAGRESDQVDNATTTKYIDAIVTGKIRVGTTPTINTQILVLPWGSNISAVTRNVDTIAGADGARTITSSGIKDVIFGEAQTINVDATTTDRDYFLRAFSVANALKLQCLPRFWGVFVTHNTGVNLNSTGGNHVLEFEGIKYDVS